MTSVDNCNPEAPSCDNAMQVESVFQPSDVRNNILGPILATVISVKYREALVDFDLRQCQSSHSSRLEHSNHLFVNKIMPGS